MEKRAYYRKIPAYFNEETLEIRGRNKFYNWLIAINIWIDINIVGIDEFPILVEKTKEEKDNETS